MKRILCLILLVLLLGCRDEDPDETNTVSTPHGSVTCKTYWNYDHTKSETKCTGTGEYAAMYADDVNGDPDGVTVEETTAGE